MATGLNIEWFKTTVVEDAERVGENSTKRSAESVEESDVQRVVESENRE